ncbi:hypothetical protein B0H10DRAFT_1944329 [Mycena sp. CBHHK59/15]|nr:hypothetical protein B0H10DRAFT_1944329 [Mycena sp. CBHHK59/15]
MDPILLALLGLFVFVAIAVSTYLILLSVRIVIPQGWKRAFNGRSLPTHVQGHLHGTRGAWSVNPINSLRAPHDFFPSLLIGAPPLAFQRVGRLQSNRRAGNTETVVRQMFIGVGFINAPPLTYHGHLHPEFTV